MTTRHPTRCLNVGLRCQNIFASTYHFHSIPTPLLAVQYTIRHLQHASPQSQPTLRSFSSTPVLHSPSSKLASIQQLESEPSPPPPLSQRPGSDPDLSLQRHDLLNPPTSTLPAPVNPPTQTSGESKIKWLYHVGKAYVAFYKTGVKNVWANRKLERALQQDSREAKNSGNPHALSPSAFQIPSKYSSLSRAEYQLTLRSRHDWRRVPIFALILLVFGEWTPLIVVFATPLVPYTCRIPSQIKKQRLAMEERRRKSFRGELKEPITVIGAGDEKEERAGRLQHICRSLGLYPSWFDNALTGGFWPPVSMMIRRVKDRIESIQTDDELLLRDALRSREELPSNSSKSSSANSTTLLPLPENVNEAARIVARRLSVAEIELACEARGIDVLGRPEKELRDTLESWLRVSGKGLMGTCSFATLEDVAIMERASVFRLFLNRPNVWREGEFMKDRL